MKNALNVFLSPPTLEGIGRKIIKKTSALNMTQRKKFDKAGAKTAYSSHLFQTLLIVKGFEDVDIEDVPFGYIQLFDDLNM